MSGSFSPAGKAADKNALANKILHEVYGLCELICFTWTPASWSVRILRKDNVNGSPHVSALATLVAMTIVCHSYLIKRGAIS